VVRFTTTSRAVIVTAILTSATLGIVLCVFLTRGSNQEQERRDELDSIARSVAADYSSPVASAGAQLSVICKDTVPDPSNAQCGRYVEVLRASDPALEGDIQALVDLRTDISGSASPPPNPLDELIAVLQAVRDNDLQIIQA
jgi:hypothetical protein